MEIAQHVLDQALTCEKPAKTNRRVLSTARFVTQGQLEKARHARLAEDETKKGKRKTAATTMPPRKRQRRGQHSSNEDIIRANDSEVERQVTALADDEEGGGFNRGRKRAVGRVGNRVPLSQVSGNRPPERSKA